jgi:hypothetical protein
MLELAVDRARPEQAEPARVLEDGLQPCRSPGLPV